MQKQLVGTSLYVIDSNITMRIPVQQSTLPIQNVKAPNQDLPKEIIYDNDARNLHFEITFKCSNGKQESDHKVELGKQKMALLFQQIQKIADQINSYS